jgi:hypothetical protein
MEAIRLNNFKIGIFSVITVLFFTLLLQSCATKIAFRNSPVVPAAEGWVKINKDKNKNYTMDLKVIRLADPKRLTPPKSVYVVWMFSEKNGTQNIGQLKTSSSLLSKALKSSLKTVASFRPDGFFITAEDNADIQYPGSQEVLRTQPY